MKKKTKLISLGSIVGVAGLSMGIGAAIPEKVINPYVPNSGINIKGPESLFFITDGGDIHDGSFNEAAYNASLAINGNSKYNYEQPKNTSFSEFKHAYDVALSRGADVLFLSGFLHAQAVTEYSAYHPETGFIFLDGETQVKPPEGQILSPNVTPDPNTGKVTQGNILPITFAIEQAAFIAGYVASAAAVQMDPQDPVLSGVGGEAIFAVTEFLAGYEHGMDYYNETVVGPGEPKVLLYQRDDLPARGDRKSPIKARGTAQYFESFAANPENKVSQYTVEALKAGVNVFFPVGGPQAFTVLGTIVDQSKTSPEKYNENKIKVIGVDQDLTKQNYPGLANKPSWINYVLGSATKGIYKSITDAAGQIYETNSEISEEFPEKGKNVFGRAHRVGLSTGMVIFTGQKLDNGETQTTDQILTEFGITGKTREDLMANAVKTKAEDPRDTGFYFPQL